MVDRSGFARKLMGIFGRDADPLSLKPLVMRWHELAEPNPSGEPSADDNWQEFCVAWQRIYLVQSKTEPNSNSQRWLELRKVAGHPFRPSSSRVGSAAKPASYQKMSSCVIIDPFWHSVGQVAGMPPAGGGVVPRARRAAVGGTRRELNDFDMLECLSKLWPRQVNIMNIRIRDVGAA